LSERVGILAAPSAASKARSWQNGETGNRQPATPVTSNQQSATSNTNQQLATTNRRPQAKPPRVGQGNPIQSETQIEQHIMIIMEMPATRLSSYASAQQQQYRIYICTTHLGTSL